MKNSIFIIAALILGIGSLHGQKLKTRNGNVKFYSEAPVENIEAINKQVSSMINLGNGEFAFLVPIKGFRFEKALMEEHFNENFMESGQYPNAKFTGKIIDPDKVDLSKDGEYEVTFAGTMEIHGTKKEIEEKATFTVKDGKAQLGSVFFLQPEAYNIEIPASRRDNIAKEIEVTVNMSYDEA